MKDCSHMSALHAFLGIPTGPRLGNSVAKLNKSALHQQNPFLNKNQENFLLKLKQYCHIQSLI
jgi:hypothetical protein